MTARILIIEDEALVAMELRFVLEDLGHEVLGVAATAQAARDLVLYQKSLKTVAV